MTKSLRDYETATALLAALRDARDTDEHAEMFPQELAKPERTTKLISSLAAQTWPMSPQLAARFALAGHWSNPFPGLDWLSPAEMKKARTNTTYRELFANRQEYWEGSVLQTNPRSHVSLFGIDVNDASEVYLVWTAKRVEPKVVWYVAQHSHEFEDFIGYLQYLVPQKKSSKGSARKRSR